MKLNDFEFTVPFLLNAEGIHHIPADSDIGLCGKLLSKTQYSHLAKHDNLTRKPSFGVVYPRSLKNINFASMSDCR